jgi:voltage-dependent calcium channel
MVVLGNVSGLSNLILFVFLLTFLAAIFASQLFRGEIPYQDSSGATIGVTFFTIYNSFLGMYQILSSENWTAIMYNVTNYDVHWNTAWIGAAFCILWFIFANCKTWYANSLGLIADILSSHRFEYVYCCHSREF